MAAFDRRLCSVLPRAAWLPAVGADGPLAAPGFAWGFTFSVLDTGSKSGRHGPAPYAARSRWRLPGDRPSELLADNRGSDPLWWHLAVGGVQGAGEAG